MDFKDIVMGRYAVKSFTGEKIPQDAIDELLEIIQYSPSSFNIQPWKIKIVTDKALKEKLQEAAWNQPQVSTCCHFLIFCADKELAKLADQLEKLMLDGGVPEEKVKGFLGMVRPFLEKFDEAESISWAQRQVYIALSNAMNGAKALGLDSCPMEGIEPDKMHQILNLPDNLVVTCGLAIGYAADQPRPKLRFKKEEIFI